MFDAVAEAHVNLKEVAAEERAGWSSSAHSDRVRDVFSIAERAEAELIRTVMGWNLVGGWEAGGQRSAVCWLVWQNQIARPRAKVLVDSAELCAEYPRIAAALAAGEIACGHVAAMARVEHPHPDEFATCAEGLLGAAADTSVVEFDWVAKQWANAVDQRAPADDRDRGLAISDTFGGKSYVKGSGSTEEAAILRKALAKDNPPDPADRPEGIRTLSQRMWDKLIDLARRELAGVDPQLDLDLDTDDQHAAPETSGNPIDDVLARYRNRPTDTNTGTEAGADAAPPAPAPAPRHRHRRCRGAGSWGARRSLRRWSPGGCAPPGSAGSSETPEPAMSWTTGAANASTTPTNAEPWLIETAAAGSPGATSAPAIATPTTSGPGPTAASPTSTGASCCVDDTMSSFTTRAGRWGATPPPVSSPPPAPTAEPSPGAPTP